MVYRLWLSLYDASSTTYSLLQPDSKSHAHCNTLYVSGVKSVANRAGPVASRLLKASLMHIVYSTSLILCLFMHIQLLLLYFYYYNILTAEFFYLY